MDPRIRKMAHVLVNYCVDVRPGNWVSVQSSFLAEPLVTACVEEILRAGGNPTAQFSSSAVTEAMLLHGNDEQLSFISPVARVLNDDLDLSIGILAPENTRALSAIDPARLSVQGQARRPLLETRMQRETDGKFDWTLCAYPTQAGAQDAGMSLRDYEEFVFGACLLDAEDPVAAWRAAGQRQQRAADWLSDKSSIHITGPGTDLTVSVAGRDWINDDGHKNFPGGEVFTGPVETETEGVIEFNLPAFYSGRETTGVRLVFTQGAVTEAHATGDDAFLQEMLNLDPGARRLGEFAFGLNQGVQRFTKNTLFDEKIGGTLHMALGFSIQGTGGQNESVLHWDMVYDLRGNGAEVTVDGETFIKDGKVQID